MVDITNQLDTQTWDSLATPAGTSSAEELQQLVPRGTPVVKAFNTAKKKLEKPAEPEPEPEEPEPTKEELLLTEIRDLLRTQQGLGPAGSASTPPPAQPGVP